MSTIQGNNIHYKQVADSFEYLHSHNVEDEDYEKNDKILKDNYYSIAAMCVLEHNKKEEIAHKLQQVRHELAMWKSGLEEEIAQKGYGADDTMSNEHAISVINAILDEQHVCVLDGSGSQGDTNDIQQRYKKTPPPGSFH